MNRELIAQLYSSDDDKKRAAIYRFLFDRRHDLVHELKKAASFETNEDIAVFMAQVCLNLETYFRDTSFERRILELLNEDGGIFDMSIKMWEYLITTGTSSMIIGVMGVMDKTIPTNAQDFMEACLNHLDPDIRSMACKVAINSGRPTHFANVLSLIADPDPIVSETAFMVVNELPSEQMAIILDYALGSTDEWVLQNVAAFLPLIIKRELRKVIFKHQYHRHPLVSQKSREALKAFDAESVARRKCKEEKNKTSEPGKKMIEEKAEEKKVLFKEQMELKKQQKLAEERQRKEDEEHLNAELAKVDSEDLENFDKELKQFGREVEGDFQAMLEDKEQAQFMENYDFDITDLDLDAANVASKAEIRSTLQAEKDNDITKESITATGPDVGTETDVETVLDTVPEVAIDFKALQNIEDLAIVEERQKTEPIDKTEAPSEDEQIPKKSEESLVVIDLAAACDDLDVLIESDDAQQDEPQSVTIEDLDDLVVVDTSVEETILAPLEVNADEPVIDVISKEVIEEEISEAPSERIVDNSVSTFAAATDGVKSVMINVTPDSVAQDIMAKYPSFIQMPYSSLFKPNKPEMLLESLQLTVDHLLAYLNLCFIQSCLFFAPPSEMLKRSIKDCLKGGLVGPVAIRCLHNFALAMKQSRENPIFFTFTLSQVFAESSDTNPLMLLRELAEYLNDPIKPLEESIPKAIEGMTEILRGCKAIMNNNLVMKAPRGAKEPFADLNGPLAQVLPVNKRPALDLPEGEVTLLSRDRGEALGLFPFFKYLKRRVYFAKPNEAEMKILLERLEINLE